MISSDRGLLGKGQLGDVLDRHREYGRHVELLDILVLSKKGYSTFRISDNVVSYPLDAPMKFLYFSRGVKIGIKLFKETAYDLVVTQDPFMTGAIGLRLKNQFKSRLLVHCHGDFFGNPEWTKKRFYRQALLIFASEVVRQADGIRVMSSTQKQKLVTMRIDKDKIRIIPTPVDIQRFVSYNDQSVMSSLARRKEEKGIKQFVLMVARKDRVKDFATLFRAMKRVFDRVPGSGLWLVGNYGEEDRKEIPLPVSRILFSRHVDTGDLPAYYRACDLTVLSSISESFGKVLVEANACGRPVVSTETSGAKEIILDGFNGFLVPIGDDGKLAEKIIQLLSDKTLSREMGERGREVVEKKFSGEKNTEKIIQFWNDLVGK